MLPFACVFWVPEDMFQLAQESEQLWGTLAQSTEPWASLRAPGSQHLPAAIMLSPGLLTWVQRLFSLQMRPFLPIRLHGQKMASGLWCLWERARPQCKAEWPSVEVDRKVSSSGHIVPTLLPIGPGR